MKLNLMDYTEHEEKQNQLKSISEWENGFNTFLLGLQGFKEGSTKDSQITLKEFLNGCMNSTLRMNQNLLWEMYFNYNFL